MVYIFNLVPKFVSHRKRCEPPALFVRSGNWYWLFEMCYLAEDRERFANRPLPAVARKRDIPAADCCRGEGSRKLSLARPCRGVSPGWALCPATVCWAQREVPLGPPCRVSVSERAVTESSTARSPPRSFSQFCTASAQSSGSICSGIPCIPGPLHPSRVV